MTVDNVSATHRKHKHQKIDWNDLRARSLQKGGFGDERVDLWPTILNAAKPKDSADEKYRRPTEPNDEVVHQDERQIGLDTDRSFVLYPVDSNTDKETLQAELHKLLVSIFRKRPRLSYFQGYHDIVTVLFLTLPPEMQLVCAEKLSLHRLRDSMGSGLEPVLGLLRVTNKLLHLADPEFAQLLERNSPLPFYALSNLLTLFSHDIPTLPLIQHVFDYLFCRPPIAVVYLATAVILSRKKEVIRLEQEDEDGLIHSLLSSLPNLADDFDEEDIIDIRPTPWKSDESLEADTSNTFFKEENDPDQIMLNNSSPHVDSKVKVESENPMDYVQNDGNRLPDSRSHSPPPTNSHEDISDNTGNATPLEHVHDDDSLSNKRDETQPKEEDADQSTRPLSETILPIELSPPINEPTKEENHDCDFVSTIHHKPERIYLTDLLRRADALYKEFPPSHPGLALSSIMGPQSVVFTWSESFSELPSDNTAEAMVSHPELVVYPYVEIDPHQKEAGSSDDKDEKSPGGGKKSRRKRRKLRKSPFGQMEKKTMLAGTVLVLGVAMAVYGIKARNAHPSHGLLYGIAEGRGHKDWRRVSGWVGGALAGMSEKIMNGLSSGS